MEKKIFVFVFCICALFLSCAKSPKDAVNVLVEDQVKKDCYHPETYEPVMTRVDSAFTPFDDPEFYDKTEQLIRLRNFVDFSFINCNGDIKKAKKQMNKITEELKAMLGMERRFIGFKAQHRFRCEDNSGQTVFGDVMLLLDKDMSQIIMKYDMNSSEYKGVQAVYEEMTGEDLLKEGEGLWW